MKKLIAIAALAACLPAFSGQVASSNTVGYQKLDIVQGWSMVTPTFKTLDATATGYAISNIVPEGANIGGYGDISIQLMNADGSWGNMYVWYTQDGWGVPDGWYDENEQLANETIPAGQALMISCDADDVTFRVLGEVELADAALPVEAGWEMFGNASPVTVHLSEIVPTGDVGGYGDISIQLMNADGSWGSQYIYYTNAGWGVPDGWYDEDEQLADVTLEAGNAFMLSCDNSDVSFTIPAPIVAE